MRMDRLCVPRPKAVYGKEAERRHYFYVIDTRGQLFLEETMPRNIATSLKDFKILNFIIKNLRPNQTEFHPDIPFISFCGKEVNFVSPMDPFSSICFKDCRWDANQLIYGGDLAHPFDPLLLAYHPDSGRIYHLIQDHKYLTGTYGLLHPHLCQKIGDDIVVAREAPTSGDLNDKAIAQSRDHKRYLFRWNDVDVPLKVLGFLEK
jgi:hypothetical protein